MTRKIIQCNNKEVTVSGDGIEYTYRLIDNPTFSFEDFNKPATKSGFEIKIVDNGIKDIIYKKLEIFNKNDARSANLGKTFARNLSNGSISWAGFKWLNSHCYTNKTKTWLTNGKLMCEIEYILFGFKLKEKLQGQCNYECVNYNDEQVFEMVFEKTHEKFRPCPICDK